MTLPQGVQIQGVTAWFQKMLKTVFKNAVQKKTVFDQTTIG